MTRDAQQRRTPAQIRAASVRLGLILFAIVAAFFVSAIVNQVMFGAHG